ncbi:hypothetical protein [Streptomyces sp. NPDC002265]|uniref:hypothetical protein n=1 Tax=Streptomyces sp. NPDC002265 TaxID=3154415 RepID=UPI00331CFB95
METQLMEKIREAQKLYYAVPAAERRTFGEPLDEECPHTVVKYSVCWVSPEHHDGAVLVGSSIN